jgi:hypothetical protein
MGKSDMGKILPKWEIASSIKGWILLVARYTQGD